MSGTQKRTKKTWGTSVHICLQYHPQGYCPVSPPQHLETNLPIKLRRLIFPMRKSNFIVEAMCYRSKPRAGQWRGCLWMQGGSTAAAEADEIDGGTPRDPVSRQPTSPDRCSSTSNNWNPPHTESPATESGPEHIFIALLKHEWMRGDTVKRDGGDVLLLPPIIPKITRRDEVLQKWVGRKRCCQQALLARPRQHCEGSTGHSSVQPGTHWPAAAGEGEWVNPV